MMLNENADDIDPVERPEVLSYLPPLEGMDIVELGAGIGRYTSDIADQQAKDFIKDIYIYICNYIYIYT